MKKRAWAILCLLSLSTSALAEKIGVSMAYFDQNFLTIIRQAIDKEAKARKLDAQFEDARGDVDQFAHFDRGAWAVVGFRTIGDWRGRLAGLIDCHPAL